MHEHFGRYILEDRIAIGGMAEIFRAKAPGLGGFEKVLAIKRLHPRYSQDADFIEMLIDEARITVELSHANIGQIFDLGKVDDHYFIAMEFIDGRDLYRVMKRLKDRGQSFPLDTAAYVAMQCCAGLDYAHRKRDSRNRPLHIVHRDVSPQNVLLSFEGDVKLVDFGIAKAALRAYETESGIIKGKFYYMSPEQAKGERLDHRTDIFSLGIVLYEMLTGDLLYKDDDEATLLSRVRKADIQTPRYLRPDIPPALERIVMKALSRDRELRYPTARHMQRDLADWLQDAGGVTNSARLAALMREIYAEVAPAHQPGPVVHGPEFADFGADEHSVISEALWQEGDDETRVDPGSVDGTSTLNSMSGFESDLMELDPDDIELVEVEDKPTVDFQNAAPLAGFDSIEVDGLGDDPFAEDDETRNLGDQAAPYHEPVPAVVAARPEPVAHARPVAVAHAQPVMHAQPVAHARPVVQARPAAGPSSRSSLQRSPGDPRGIRRSNDRNRRVVLRPEAEEAGFTRQPTVIVPREGARAPREPVPQGRPAVHRPAGRASRLMETPAQATLNPPAEGWLSRDRLLMGLFLLGVIIAAGVITSLLVDDPPPGPAAPPVAARTVISAAAPVSAVPVTAAPAVTTATLNVTSFPSGARVRIDGKWQTHEATPTRYAIPAGRPVELRVQLENYEPFESRVTLEPGQTETVHARLERIRGAITIESKPSGALVTVDGRDVGRTPLTVNDLPMEAAARVRITKDGFVPFETTVQWGGRRDQTVDANLEPVEAKPPVVAEAPQAVEREAPKPVRRRRVVRRDPDPEPIARRPVQRRPVARRPAARREPTGSGFISVIARQWGSVFINGALVAAETPLFKYQVPSGTHQVKVCFQGDRRRCTAARRVVVNPGQNAKVKF
ncbi:MAG: PEGA domain-containing protein [Myxococcales bacterium]|nr:PEGA domain-containing protein [Myxococcales bacterium]